MRFGIKDSNFKRAFTLAEALVTLMIIGVVMSLLLRTINRVNPDKDKILFLKSFHAIEHAVVNILNDSSKYNQQYLSETDRTSGAYTLNHDFRDNPFPSASVTVISGGSAVEKTGLSRSVALCYFFADQLNTIGDVDCESNTGITVSGSTVTGANFRISNGVCFSMLSGVGEDGTLDAVVDPGCKGASNGYVVRIFKDGKVTVPSTATGYDNQSKAYDWMQKQSEIN